MFSIEGMERERNWGLTVVLYKPYRTAKQFLGGYLVETPAPDEVVAFVYLYILTW